MVEQNKSGAEDKSGRNALIVLIIAGAAYYVFDWGFLHSAISTYPLFCETALSGDKCPQGWIQGKRTVYRVNRDTQTVVAQTDGEPPRRLEKCAVVDRTNWKCNEGESVTFGFTNGEFWSGYEQYGNPVSVKPPNTFRYAARWDWIGAKKDSKTK